MAGDVFELLVSYPDGHIEFIEETFYLLEKAKRIWRKHDEPGNCERFFGIRGEHAKSLFFALLNRYIGKEDPVIADKIKLIGYLQMVWWNRINEPENMVRLEGCKGRLLS